MQEKEDNTDLLNLTDEQRLFVVKRFITNDVYTCFNLDMGKNILNNAPTNVAASRLKEAKDYIRESVCTHLNRAILVDTTNYKNTIQEGLNELKMFLQAYSIV